MSEIWILQQLTKKGDPAMIQTRNIPALAMRALKGALTHNQAPGRCVACDAANGFIRYFERRTL